MGTFADENILYTNNPSPSTAVGLAQMRLNQVAIKELAGASAPVFLTIADGAILPSSAYLIVDTEGQAAADDLTVINPVLSATDNLHDGMLLFLQAADQSRVVTVRNSSSANGILTADGNDVVLDTVNWYCVQLRQGTWHEVQGLREAAFARRPVVKATSPVIALQQTDITKGTNPSGSQYAYIHMVDSAGSVTANRTGMLENKVDGAGLTSTSLRAYQFADGSTNNAGLGVHCSADGSTKYATAPTPAAGDNSNKIATTEWVWPHAAHAAMPSGQYISLSIPSANSTVIAPADGYYLLVFKNTSGSSGATAGYTTLLTSRAQVRSFNPVGGSINADVLLPVSKGDVVTILDVVRATILRFEFIYANGSAPA